MLSLSPGCSATVFGDSMSTLSSDAHFALFTQCHSLPTTPPEKHQVLNNSATFIDN